MKVKLTRGKYTRVSMEDYAELSQYKWYAMKGRTTWYAVRNYINKDGDKRLLYMHRVILNPTYKAYVDHENHNGLDNRRSNLRLYTHSENTRNQRKTRGTSIYKGVYWNKRDKRWLAQIKSQDKRKHLGSFKCEKEAAAAYNEAALAYHKEFAHLNVIN